MSSQLTSTPVFSTLYRGLAVLEFLGAGPATITEIGEQTGLSRQNVYRTLKTIAAYGWIENASAENQYQISTRVWTFATQSFRLEHVREAFSGIVEDLAQETGESVHLATYEHGKVFTLDTADGWQPISSYSKLGDYSPAHATATGKCLLASLSEVRIEKFLTQPLASYTDQTITSATRMREELATVAAKGFAINHGEWQKDVGGVAVLAAKLPDGTSVALGLHGPKDRIVNTADYLIEQLQSAVNSSNI